MVTEAPDRAIVERGWTGALRLDNGTECMSHAFSAWTHAHRVSLEFSRLGKPVENALVEHFNGKLRDECLTANQLTSLKDVRRHIETWQRDHKT
jgi:putative transposase